MRKFTVLATLGGVASLAMVASATPIRTHHERTSGNRSNWTEGGSTIWSQPYDGLGDTRVAQSFPDFPSFSSYEFDDFSTAASYFVGDLFAPGLETGVSGANIAVIGEIWTGLPDLGGVLVMSGAGVEDGAGTLNINFGGQLLTPGSYWVTAYVNRSFGGGGQWFWYGTQPVNGSQSQFYNPGGGFGFGTGSQNGSNIFGVAADMAFLLEGNLVPAPASLGLLGLGGLMIGSRRRRN